VFECLNELGIAAELAHIFVPSFRVLREEYFCTCPEIII
jgi:hypothetical protein